MRDTLRAARDEAFGTPEHMQNEIAAGAIGAVDEGSWVHLAKAGRHGLFVSPYWLAAAHEAFEPSASVTAYTARDGQRLLALLPVARRRMNHLGLYLTVHDAFLGTRGDASYPLVDPARPELLQPLLAAAARAARSGGALRIANVPEEGGRAQAVRDALRALGLPVRETSAACRILRLPSDVAGIDACLPRKLKADIRRREAKIEQELGALAFRRVESKEEILQALPSLFEMHDRRWTEKGLAGSFGTESSRSYFVGLVRHLPDEVLHFTVLAAAGTPIAYHFGMVWDRHLLHFKPAYDPGLARFSPGKLHLRRLLNMLVVERIVGVDFLQGGEVYKSEWAEETYRTSTFTVRTAALAPTFWWLTRGRPALERRFWRVYTKLAALADRLRSRRKPLLADVTSQSVSSSE